MSINIYKYCIYKSYMEKKNIKNMLEDITKEITLLDDEKNLYKMTKQYDKISNSLKKSGKMIHKLNDKFKSININNTDNNIDDVQYELYTNEFENEIEKIINNENLEYQIENYEKISNKLDLCKKYLESQKMIIINCDQDTKNKKNT